MDVKLKITLKVKNHKLELDEEEAKNLYYNLKNIFEPNNTTNYPYLSVPYYPFPFYKEQSEQPVVTYPIVTCETKTGETK